MNSKWTEFSFFFSLNQEYIGNYCEFFYFLTNFGAPKHHVIEVNVRNKVNMWNVDVVIPVSVHFYRQSDDFVLKVRKKKFFWRKILVVTECWWRLKNTLITCTWFTWKMCRYWFRDDCHFNTFVSNSLLFFHFRRLFFNRTQCIYTLWPAVASNSKSI